MILFWFWKVQYTERELEKKRVNLEHKIKNNSSTKPHKIKKDFFF